MVKSVVPTQTTNLASATPAPLAIRVTKAPPIVGLGRTKFFEEIRAGNIRTFRIDGCHLVSMDELARYVRERSGER